MARRNLKKLMMYRNPEYLGGRCPCCRLRMRNYAHEFYPNMCDHCRNTRVGLQDDIQGRAPTPVPSLDHAVLMEIADDLRGFSKHTAKQPLAPQNNKDRELLLKAYNSMPDGSPAKCEAAKLLGLDVPVVQTLNTPVNRTEDLKKKILDVLQ
jgi:hypothetical protein